jgi:hypothetical protein
MQGLTMTPHPGTHVVQRASPPVPGFMRTVKIWDCTVCDQPFPNFDIILASCRHTYHPWCALQHFRKSTVCADFSYKSQMPLQWLESFGFCEPNLTVFDEHVVREIEENRVMALAGCKAAAVLLFPEGGTSSFFHFRAYTFGVSVLRFYYTLCRINPYFVQFYMW